MWALIRIRGRLLELGGLFTKTHSMGGAYSEGGAYWKEGAKSNHYGKRGLTEIIPLYSRYCK